MLNPALTKAGSASVVPTREITAADETDRESASRSPAVAHADFGGTLARTSEGKPQGDVPRTDEPKRASETQGETGELSRRQTATSAGTVAPRTERPCGEFPIARASDHSEGQEAISDVQAAGPIPPGWQITNATRTTPPNPPMPTTAKATTQIGSRGGSPANGVDVAQLNPENEAASSFSESLKAVANSNDAESREAALPPAARSLTASAWLHLAGSVSGDRLAHAESLTQRLDHFDNGATADPRQPGVTAMHGDLLVGHSHALANSSAVTTGSTADLSPWLTRAGDILWQISSVTLAASEAASASGDTRVELQLNPPELGRVWIELTETQDGLQARIVCSRESSFQLLKGEAATLRNSLAEAGVSVSEFHVGYDNQPSDGSASRWGRDELTSWPPLVIARRKALAADAGSPDMIRFVRHGRSRVDLRL